MARVAVLAFVLFQAAWSFAQPTNVGVVNGKAIEIEQAPYMALLIQTANKDPCGGIIIHEQFMLTTSTCCDERESRPNLALVGTNRKGSSTSVKVEKIFKYTQELRPSLCAVKLATPLEFNEKVNKTVLDDGSLILSGGTLVTLTGFGAKSKNDKSRRRLRQGAIPIVDNDWCKKEAEHLGDTQFCAGDKQNNACFGDVGGALTYEQKLIGVVAQPPNDCGHRATRFVRISAVKKWIDEIIANNL